MVKTNQITKLGAPLALVLQFWSCDGVPIDGDGPGSEWVPLIVSFSLLGVAVVFGMWVLLREFVFRNGCPADEAQPPLNLEISDKLEAGTSFVNDNHASDFHDSSMNLIAWSNLGCTYTAKKASQSDATILQNAYGCLKTGELTAIMGPSGAGKTTLLDILGGRKTVGTIIGRMSVMGHVITDMKKAGTLLRDATAFVPQELSFCPMQTPEEAVRFVACLRHGRNAADVVKVAQILKDVGLDDPALYSRSIGGELAGGLNVRGLSGGERKRLALACALAMKPRLMMLDEITSGLDSENARATMQLVKRVCKASDMAAVVVIHQPNGYIFETFDKLILLSSGNCIFSDYASKLDDLYANKFGESMPSDGHELPLDIMRKLKDLKPEEFVASPTQIDESVNHDTTNSSHYDDFAFTDQHQTRVPFHWKLRVVFHRNLTNHYVRNFNNLAARLLVYILCSLMDGALFWQVGKEHDETIIGAFTFIILISYLIPYAVLPLFVHEKKFFLSECALDLYSPWIYCIAQGLLEMWVVVLAAALEAVIVIPMCSLWNPVMSRWESFFMLLSALMGSGLVGSALVLFFSVLLPSQDLAFLFGAGFVTLSLGLSGGFVPFPSIAGAVSWLQWISPCKYSLQALSLGFFLGTPEEETIVAAVALDRPSTVTANIAVLFLIYFILAIGTMLALSMKREVR